MVDKYQLSCNHPYYHDSYEEYLEIIKASLSSKSPEEQTFALRLCRALPAVYQRRVLTTAENVFL